MTDGTLTVTEKTGSGRAQTPHERSMSFDSLAGRGGGHIDLDEFTHLVSSRIPQFWERRSWILDREAQVKAEGWRLLHPSTLQAVLRYYVEAKECYVWGTFLGSISTCMAAVERWLRARTGNDKDRLQFVIDEAQKSGSVSDSLAEELHYLRELVRNPPAHGDEVLWRIGALGGKRVERNLWEAPEGRYLISPEEAAREALQAFLKLVDESAPRSP